MEGCIICGAGGGVMVEAGGAGRETFSLERRGSLERVGSFAAGIAGTADCGVDLGDAL